MVKLEALQDQVYQSAYHNKLQGFLYKVLEVAGYGFIHDESPFKFVTFSNIFPPTDMTEGDERSWIVASPNEHLVKSLRTEIYRENEIQVGDQRFEVTSTSTFSIDPEMEGEMITGTPIVVRIPQGRCSKYGIDAEYDDVYWKMDHPREAFVKEVETNLASKYEEYHGEEPPEPHYFSEFEPIKEVGVPLRYEDTEVDVVGTTWRLKYNCKTEEDLEIIKLAYNAGVGELNTTGFGFMNPET